MNTPIRRMHENHFKLAEDKLKKETGKTWDEMFPQGEYYEPDPHPDAQSAPGACGMHRRRDRQAQEQARLDLHHADPVHGSGNRLVARGGLYCPRRDERSRVLQSHGKFGDGRHDRALQRADPAVAELHSPERHLHQARGRAVLWHGPQRLHLQCQHPPGYPHGRREALLSQTGAPSARCRWKNGSARASSPISRTWSAIPAFTPPR